MTSKDLHAAHQKLAPRTRKKIRKAKGQDLSPKPQPRGACMLASRVTRDAFYKGRACARSRPTARGTHLRQGFVYRSFPG